MAAKKGPSITWAILIIALAVGGIAIATVWSRCSGPEAWLDKALGGDPDEPPEPPPSDSMKGAPGPDNTIKEMPDELPQDTKDEDPQEDETGEDS